MPSNSFFFKKPTSCIVCKKEFFREVLRSGQGRLISLFLRPDLRRVYKSSEKYGEVFPLIYNATVCPHCYFAALNEDFLQEDLFNIDALKKNKKMRMALAKEIFPEMTIDFSKTRDLYHGILSFFLAANCYNFSPSDGYANAKKGFSLLRGSWCCFDAHEKENEKDQEFHKLSIYFRHQAFHSYKKTLSLMYKTKGGFGNITNYGPDLDTNYGYNGFIYIYCYYSIYFLSLIENPKKRLEELNQTQTYLSKVFGFGKSSRDKPSALLEIARDLYSTIRAEQAKLAEYVEIAKDSKKETN